MKNKLKGLLIQLASIFSNNKAAGLTSIAVLTSLWLPSYPLALIAVALIARSAYFRYLDDIKAATPANVPPQVEQEVQAIKAEVQKMSLAIGMRRIGQ